MFTSLLNCLEMNCVELLVIMATDNVVRVQNGRYPHGSCTLTCVPSSAQRSRWWVMSQHVYACMGSLHSSRHGDQIWCRMDRMAEKAEMISCLWYLFPFSLRCCCCMVSSDPLHLRCGSLTGFLLMASKYPACSRSLQSFQLYSISSLEMRMSVVLQWWIYPVES